jgi:hypothetical protein
MVPCAWKWFPREPERSFPDQAGARDSRGLSFCAPCLLHIPGEGGLGPLFLIVGSANFELCCQLKELFGAQSWDIRKLFRSAVFESFNTFRCVCFIHGNPPFQNSAYSAICASLVASNTAFLI